MIFLAQCCMNLLTIMLTISANMAYSTGLLKVLQNILLHGSEDNKVIFIYLYCLTFFRLGTREGVESHVLKQQISVMTPDLMFT